MDEAVSWSLAECAARAPEQTLRFGTRHFSRCRWSTRGR